MSIKNQIIALFKEHHDLTVREIVDRLEVTKQSVHLVLNKLTADGVVRKSGKAPKTLYRWVEKKEGTTKKILLSDVENEILDKEFLLITETGEMLIGLQGFQEWCVRRKQPTQKTIAEFIETVAKYKLYKNSDGLISGLDKLKNTEGFTQVCLDELYYLDFYAIERFGKTRLGTLLHYAKQGQNRMLMKLMLQEIEGRVQHLVESQKIDAVVFVPPTIRRELQFMKFMQQKLSLKIPIVEVKKVSGIIPVPQKSLNKIEERINNARETFAVTDLNRYKKVLMIDDAVGSGATMNEIACKLKNKHVAVEVIGLAFTGSFKGFDVITDV
jgi:predicted transcriptional regulator